jgi:hypothetical protein
MNDYAFFKYQAKLTNTGHDENDGESVHCMIRMKNVNRDGKRLHGIELYQQAEDDVLFVINPGPHRAINHSSIWNVTEEELHKLEKVSDYHRVGDCEIYFHNAAKGTGALNLLHLLQKAEPAAPQRERFDDNDRRAQGKSQSWHAFKTP